MFFAQPLPAGEIGAGTFDISDRFKRKTDGTVWEVVARRADSSVAEMRQMYWIGPERNLGFVGWHFNLDNPLTVFTGKEVFDQFDPLDGDAPAPKNVTEKESVTIMQQEPKDMTTSELVCEIAGFMKRYSESLERHEWERHRAVCAELDSRIPVRR
jgi:hypothetical protein